jgi:hypothetical protein
MGFARVIWKPTGVFSPDALAAIVFPYGARAV